ncbi:hypothetical protein [Pontiella sp.]|uniref:hypothetical protein n=2 Tax=Pontiella sp. TaxID=2837462 RepID=UPI003566C7BE
MKKLLMSALTGVALAGCSTVKEGQPSLKIESSKEVQLTNVTVTPMADGLAVSGTFRPTSPNVRRTGHVDIAFVDAAGEALTRVKAMPHIHRFSRNAMQKPSFDVTAEVDESRVALVRVTHHPDLIQECEL